MEEILKIMRRPDFYRDDSFTYHLVLNKTHAKNRSFPTRSSQYFLLFHNLTSLTKVLTHQTPLVVFAALFVLGVDKKNGLRNFEMLSASGYP